MRCGNLRYRHLALQEDCGLPIQNVIVSLSFMENFNSLGISSIPNNINLSRTAIGVPSENNPSGEV